MKISILIHKNDPYPKRENHLIWKISKVWEQMGIKVEVLRGTSKSVRSTDLLIPHIDLTKIPDKYHNYAKRFPKVLNRNITDISKKKISNNLLSSSSAYDGPVIVKTNLNYAGLPEMRLDWKFRFRKKWHNKWHSISNSSKISHYNLRSEHYPVFQTLREVPSEVWFNPNLVVEKFIPERHNKYYCIRVYLFLGDAIISSRIHSFTPVIKGGAVFSEPVKVPDEIFSLREKMGFDYGKFDYVIHRGRVHLLDVNKTPGIINKPEKDAELGVRLAKGIMKYLG